MTGRIAITIIASLLVLGCATHPPGPDGVGAASSATGDPGTAPDDVADSEQAPVVEVAPEVESGSEPAVEPAAEPVPAETPEPSADSAPIEVPEATYDRAFAEVKALIEELNLIIYRGDYNGWLAYLTDRYVEKYSDPETLAAASLQPVLKQSGIVLYNLRDYFEFVVVPSRARARLDDLVFYSDTLVEAVSIFRGERVILYLLRQVEGAWKIDTF